jgi:hypothetical protein
VSRIRDRLALFVGLAAIAGGSFAAIRKAWLCDDAFISFRYAENLTNGLGLVYNAGERVEGYTNFLWTLGIALGMRLGVAPETWSIAWGVVFYVATMVLLLIDHRTRAREAPPQDAGAAAGVTALAPIACLVAAAHPDWQVYATSGLETAMFTFLVTAGYLLGVRDRRGVRGLAGSGLAFGLAALTRPDAVLFVPIMVAYAVWARRPRIASAAAFGAAFVVVWLPHAIWKVAYYGEFLPNTWYAKSAWLAWYDQGWHYVSLYFRKYWVLALALPLAAWALDRHASAARRSSATSGGGSDASAAPEKRRGVLRGDRSALRRMVLALALGIAYTALVLRVGGDFMYARLLIPATPFFAMALASGVDLLLARRPARHGIAAALCVGGVALTPLPLRGTEVMNGVVNEWRVYRPDVLARARREGLIVRRFIEGLPVRVAFVGSQAALVYYARPAVAIESSTGLTDRWIARQPLTKRGWVGHEKLAPVSYLLERKVHFTLRHFSAVTLGLDQDIPDVPIAFDTLYARIVHWDPAVLAEVERRGAVFSDIPKGMDGYIATFDRASDEGVQESYRLLKAFYFDHVNDPVRERAFEERLGRARRLQER